LHRYLRTLDSFLATRPTLVGRNLNADEIIELLGRR
jgi:hypothetical protein